MWLLKGKMGWLSNYGNLIIVMLILVSQFRVKACYSGTFWVRKCFFRVHFVLFWGKFSFI
jgi:hypothetical protein